jgi:hypothetical protein
MCICICICVYVCICACVSKLTPCPPPPHTHTHTHTHQEARKKLVNAIKYGYPVVIAMTTSVTDFATTFNDSSAASMGLDTSGILV